MDGNEGEPSTRGGTEGTQSWHGGDTEPARRGHRAGTRAMSFRRRNIPGPAASEAGKRWPSMRCFPQFGHFWGGVPPCGCFWERWGVSRPEAGGFA